MSWDADASGASLLGFTGPERDRALFEIRERARQSLAVQAALRLVAQFRRGAREPVAPANLVATTTAALELARVAFAQLAWEPWHGDGFHADCERCLAELERLVTALSCDRLPPPLELAHGMDGVIALLVQAGVASRRVAAP